MANTNNLPCYLIVPFTETLLYTSDIPFSGIVAIGSLFLSFLLTVGVFGNRKLDFDVCSSISEKIPESHWKFSWNKETTKDQGQV
jgi:hypothetical protein